MVLYRNSFITINIGVFPSIFSLDVNDQACFLIRKNLPRKIDKLSLSRLFNNQSVIRYHFPLFR